MKKTQVKYAFLCESLCMARGFAASKTKKEFLDKIGLVEGNARHEEIFRRMLDEATAGRQRISHPDCLTPESQNNPKVVPPYTYNQISETARHQEILNIYRTASPLTRPFYDMGSYMNGANEENWAVRWCLYHSFRYTDNRNRNRTRTGGGRGNSGSNGSPRTRTSMSDEDPSTDLDTPQAGSSSGRSPSAPNAFQTEPGVIAVAAVRNGYYDPARDV